MTALRGPMDLLDSYGIGAGPAPVRIVTWPGNANSTSVRPRRAADVSITYEKGIRIASSPEAGSRAPPRAQILNRRSLEPGPVIDRCPDWVDDLDIRDPAISGDARDGPLDSRIDC